MTNSELGLRVSVATLNRVFFPDPHSGTPMLALERKATQSDGGVYVRAQPFGGAVRLLDPAALSALIGDFEYDSPRSRSEQDFRILIRPADWQTVRDFCVRHLRNDGDSVLETDPGRELVEEFEECLQAKLEPHHYSYRSIGMVVENAPTPTNNARSPGTPTVRIYRIYEVQISDPALSLALLTASQQHTEALLRDKVLADARNGGRGRANTVLTIAPDVLRNAYLRLAPEERYAPINVDGHLLTESVLAVLNDIEVPQLAWQ
ncbi:MAG: hypothetical protein KF726_10765 [Anaerolineae bacterium]|nr:hypothetical protein [Anaerolineae bacterium]